MKELLAYTLEQAVAQGADTAEAGLSDGSGLSVNVRLGEVETLEYHQDRGLGVTVYMGKHKGSSSSSDYSHKAIREVVKAACDIARYTGEDDAHGLADGDLMAQDIPDLDLYHPWDIAVDDAIDLAKSCEDAARAEDARITNSEGASISTYQGLSMYGNTHGFMAGYPTTRHSMSCSVIGSIDDEMERDYWYSTSRLPAEVEAPESIGKHAAQRTLRRLGGRRIDTQSVPVILAADIAPSLLGNFIAAIRGGNLYRESSFLLDHLGKKIFPDFVHIYEQPRLLRALGSATFDSEGVATADRRDLIEQGVLQSYVLNSYSARRLQMETTANAGGVRNLTVTSGEYDLPQMLKEMGTGLLVTELMGQGVNIVTGDYSRGAAGFWVEHGEIQYPVHEITIAGNLRDMFSGIVAVGNDVEMRGNTRTGSIWLESMMIAGS
ncbi:MAG: metalloprotease PmbA [Gammaproteobacteria bacterium]|nr:metalloprotease PmbA [Gammaproteobacteria bacterium]